MIGKGEVLFLCGAFLAAILSRLFADELGLDRTWAPIVGFLGFLVLFVVACVVAHWIEATRSRKKRITQDAKNESESP
jgi:multisubunit Na+/H+ antiporter MnhE subunit